jgi:hypothetical protein
VFSHPIPRGFPVPRSVNLPTGNTVVARIDSLLLADAQSALASDRAPDVERLLQQGSESMRASPEARRLLAGAEIATGKACLERNDYRCAVERAAGASAEDAAAAQQLREQALSALRQRVDESIGATDAKDLKLRVAALTDATALLSEFETLSRPEASAPSDQLARLRERLVKDRSALERQLAAVERKLAAQRAAQAARERREEEREARRRAAEERRNESRSYGGGCCKYCSRGKPCGDTCIARNKTCHVGGGCAC